MLKELKEKSHHCVDSIKKESEELALYIGTHPELGYQEFEASKRLTTFLADHGFTIELGIAGIETAFIAKKTRGTGPVIAFLAEYDALPILGHACGHNLSGVASAAAAIATADALGDKLEGTLMVVGCPAEEGAVPNAGSKVILVDKGIFNGVHVALSSHAGPRNILERSHYGRILLEFNFYGKSAHTAAGPEEGINAFDAAVLTINAINALRQQTAENVRLHGYITKGGTIVNTVPDHAQILYGVRTKDMSQMDSLLERVLNCARGAALATGCRFEYNHPGNTYLPVRVNRLLQDLIAANMNDMKMDYIPFSASSAGSTDIGNISQQVPTTYPVISHGDEEAHPHTKRFQEASCSQKGAESVHTAAKLLAATALDVLVDPDLRKRFLENKGL